MTIKITFPEMKLRLSPALKRQIEAAAADNSRTMNAEVVARLTWSFEHDAQGTDSVAKVLGVTSASELIEDRVTRLEQQVAELQQAQGLVGRETTESPSKKLLAKGRDKAD